MKNYFITQFLYGIRLGLAPHIKFRGEYIRRFIIKIRQSYVRYFIRTVYLYILFDCLEKVLRTLRFGVTENPAGDSWEGD